MANPTYEELVERVEDLESMLRGTAGIPLQSLPLQPLADRLSETMIPEGDVHLLPHSTGADSLASMPNARIYATTLTTVPSATYTACNFQVVQFNDGMQIDLTNLATRITVVRPGIYIATGGGGFESPVAGMVVSAGISLNANLGATFDANTHIAQGTAPPLPSYTDIFRCAAGDYFELRLFQDSGVNKDTRNVDTVRSHLAVQYVSYVEGL